jgi:cbb3-type cytochrome oxidase cytochrome c subunit
VKRGEKIILGGVIVLAAAGGVRAVLQKPAAQDREIPFYSTAAAALAEPANDLYRRLGCKQCHSLWTLRDMTQAVPAPMLDGIGSLRSEAWLYDYLSSPDPQRILPSRLKPQYRMPSYRDLPEPDRRLLAGYLASLKVKDWYLDETRKLERQKLTGED